MTSDRYAPILLLVLVLTVLSCGCTESNQLWVSNVTSWILGDDPLQEDVPFPGELVTPAVGQDNTSTPWDLRHPVISPWYQSSIVYRNFTFNYGKEERRMIVPIDESVYMGARYANKTYPYTAAWRRNTTWRDRYYSSMLTDPAQDGFYENLLTEMRRIKRTENLNDDQYLELITAFVQQIPLEVNVTDYPRFPIEVIYDQKGDCDEKAMLLTALLWREGYDVALLVFQGIDHPATAVRIVTGAQPSFVTYGSGAGKYMYIEPATPAFIGMQPDIIENRSVVVVPVEGGKITYRDVNSAMYVVQGLEKINRTLDYLNLEIHIMNNEIPKLEKKVVRSYEEESERERDKVRLAELTARRNHYNETRRQLQEVQNFTVANFHDLRGVLWKMESSHVLELSY
jgi:hypothetical protein